MGEGAFKKVGSYADPVVPNIGSYLGSGRLGVTKNDGSVTDPVFLTFLSNTSSLSLSLDGENSKPSHMMLLPPLALKIKVP